MQDTNLGLRRLRYQKLAETLAQSIRSGEYKIGELLPSEIDLCRDFEVSRFTVREALRYLQASGLIERRHGIGSLVVASEPPIRYSHTITSVEDILQYAEATHLTKHRIRMVKADAALAAELGCQRGTRFVYMEAVRVEARDGRPSVSISWSRVYLIEKYAGLRGRLKPAQHSIAELVERTYGEPTIAVDQNIRAVAIDANAAKALDVPRNSPGLRVDRRYIGSDNEPYLHVIAVHPAARFSLSMRLDRIIHRQDHRETTT